ncbi:hypothetical protein HMPREF9353_00210 [Treponema denticola F0402]|nr:hypothetical protein HMPREF9353_00210 [Treponema denticola F0402]
MTHEDIRLSIEEKSDMENVKNKNDVATEYSLQILQINRNSTAQEKNQFVYIVIYRPTGCICPAMIILIFIVY